MDPDPDPGGLKTYRSDGSGFGSATRQRTRALLALTERQEKNPSWCAIKKYLQLARFCENQAKMAVIFCKKKIGSSKDGIIIKKTL